MSNWLMIGLGQAGNKAVMDAIRGGVIDESSTILINSTPKDFPKDYTGDTLIISPNQAGCGKERKISRAYIINLIKNDILSKSKIKDYSNVLLVSSVEGGTGSGATPLVSQYISTALVKNCTVFAFTGFGDDPRGLANTVEFFKELDDSIIVHTISNAAFLESTEGNRTKAEELANQEFVTRFKILSGQTLIPGDQNIDDTDIIKLSNTYGYSTVEYKELDKSLAESSDYDKIIKRMIYDSKSIKTVDPCATKLGVVLNLNENSQAVLSDVFATLKENYGTAFECFKQIQYDGKKEYIAYIVSGMKLPIEELNKIYESYVEESNKVNKKKDSFFDQMKNMNLLEEDEKFNMIKPVKKGLSSEEFLAKL